MGKMIQSENSGNPEYSENYNTPFASNESASSTATQNVAPSRVVTTSKDYGKGEAVRLSAQKINTAVYLEKGYVTHQQLNDQGLYVDDYADRSVYLISENSTRDSACRYIKADKKDGILSLPTAKHFAVDPDALRHAAGVDRLSDIKPKEVIEVSALSSVRRQNEGPAEKSINELDATRLLYARILRESLDNGHKLWLLNTHEKLVRYLEILLGEDQIHRLGDTRDYLGSPTVPIAINPQRVVESALADDTQHGDMKREYLRQTLGGVSRLHLNKSLVKLLEENDIDYEDGPLLKRVIRNKKAIGYTAIAGYTAARAVPVANIEQFEGNPWIFFGIDFASSFPYAWGLIESVSGKTPARKVVGGSVAAGSFAAPYAYFWAEGNEYPVWVNGVVAGIVGVAGVTAAVGIRKDAQISNKLLEVQAV